VSGASRETWERAAEELVRYVRLLLSDHGSAIEKALKKSIGKDQAEAEIQQLEHLVVALELELWRRRTGPREALVIPAVRCIRTTLLAIGLSVTSVVTAEVYKDLTAAQEQAEKVCLLQENDGSFSLDQPGAPTRGKAPARPFLEDDEQRRCGSSRLGVGTGRARAEGDGVQRDGGPRCVRPRPRAG
jgi:hypothetical protein